MSQTHWFSDFKRWFLPPNNLGNRVARFSSGIVILVGCLVLIGWSFDWEVFKSILPGTATTKANTALCFLLAGMSLGLQARNQQSSLTVRMAQGSAIVVTIIGGLTLIQYIFGWNLGIDELLFQEFPTTPFTSHPGRMGDNTALDFVLSGVALQMITHRTRLSDFIIEMATVVTGAIALLALMGYFYGVQAFHQFLFYATSMSLPSALSFLVLCGGILALRSDRGFMRTLTGNLAGSLAAQKLVPVAIAVPFILGWLIARGVQANVYDSTFGIALLSIALIYTLVLVILVVAQKLNKVDYDRKRSSDRLRSREDALKLAQSAANAGVWDWNLSTDVLTCSSEYYKMHGFDPTLPAVSWANAMLEADRVRVSLELQHAIARRSEVNSEYRIMHPTLGVRWVLTVGRLVGDAQLPQRMTGITLDITDRKQAQQEREHLLAQEQSAREEAERLNRLKDEFLAALSHELRTPLNPILGWTKMMQAQKLTPTKTVQALDTIERNVQQQMRLVDDLLDLSSIIQGKLSLQSNPVELALMLSEAIATVQFSAQAKGISIKRCGLLSLTTVGDGDRLQQIFWNLLSNAIKFTPQGGHIKVELSTTSVETAHFAQIQITDGGIGISPEFLPHVFDQFRQADGSSTRNYGGLGLGLAIVRQLVELHGGTVRAESLGLEQGATFTVKLPLQIPDALFSPTPTAPSTPTANEPPRIASESAVSKSAIPESVIAPMPLSGVRILLVDDEPDNLEVLSFLLEQDGAIVTAVSCPLKALEILSERLPDIIVSDIGMPKMDGYELIRRMKAMPQGNQVPALALTGFIHHKDQEEAIKAGFQRYISKPVDPIQLLTVLAQMAFQEVP